MTAERISKTWVFHCDKCPDFYESEEVVLSDALAEMKSAGWSVYRDNMDWCHACPDCGQKVNRPPQVTEASKRWRPQS